MPLFKIDAPSWDRILFELAETVLRSMWLSAGPFGKGIKNPLKFFN